MWKVSGQQLMPSDFLPVSALWPCDLIIGFFFTCFCNVRLQCHRANADFLPVFSLWPCDLIIVHLFTCFCNVRLQCHRANSDFLPVFAPWPCDLIIVHLFTCFCNVRLQCHRANSDFLTVSWALQCSSFHTDKDQVLSLTSLNHTLCFINSCQTYTWYITMISSSYSYKHLELVCWFSGA